MMKFMIVARRATGRTRKGALDHLRDIHAKMVVCPPSGAGPMPLDYVQNHVIDGAYLGVGDHAIERDLVTELWFESVEHLRTSTATPYYLENLRPDEPRFVDDATVARMMVNPRAAFGTATGRFKLFVFLGRRHGDDTGWGIARDALAAAFAGSPDMIAAVENEVMPPPTGDPVFVDMILEGWFETANGAETALRDMVSHLAGPKADGIASEKAFAVVAEQYDKARLRALHGCSAS